MPAHSFLNDEDLAEVLSYTWQNFNNQVSSIKPDEVKKEREVLKNKK